MEVLEAAAIPMSEGETAPVEMMTATGKLLAPDRACTRIHSKTYDSPGWKCRIRRISCLWPSKSKDDVQARAGDGCLEEV